MVTQVIDLIGHKNIYKNRARSQGKELADAYVAKPGFSEHQTGLCIDITNKDRYFVQGTKEADWLAKIVTDLVLL